MGHLPFEELRVVLGSFLIFTVESGDLIDQFSRSHWDRDLLCGKERLYLFAPLYKGHFFFHYNIALVAIFLTYFIIKIFGFFFLLGIKYLNY